MRVYIKREDVDEEVKIICTGTPQNLILQQDISPATTAVDAFLKLEKNMLFMSPSFPSAIALCT
jgi:hypothetical protein